MMSITLSWRGLLDFRPFFLVKRGVSPQPGLKRKGDFLSTMRRGYIRAWDTADLARHILDIKPINNLLSW
jgi:hypothetical protein